MKKKTLMSWSSGKDSAWALYQLQNDPEIELKGLICTVNKEFDRVAMHGVRVELLKAQANSIGLPLEIIELPNPCSHKDYAKIMGKFLQRMQNEGIDCMAFGDLYLEDIRAYRENNLAGTGITALFPLWQIPTGQLSREMLNGGLKTVITCVDPKQAPAELAGREYNQAFIDGLPDSVDPCGENGEFHSFVFDGPMLRHKIDITVGEIVTRDNFVFADLLPGTAGN
ncbi:adenine nucleotide alpha hydrolase [uncultured Amphritea sp.]|uniref:adenine nucleotide alpha hydrolase n=1 Tax=uncultured Amphritea sp. TaxID=981605 RepID=UPI0025FB68AF|nr:adenine nucleotide alpha hydrolase [uncultured Amphritea sp.]